ncbi:acyloxyacyl hydrolase [Acidovorax sp. A1169]|uniref:acyloxyacyl hydrolase n=1 Tax=Acidovorax sp. A1169 TaxID=3059524 RepID=UPI002737FD54|nr:acyloxyacyl hydrolase [Acidovorax sp. A1169]MDP4075596.1 acyloxyacyl hydrolase [Acidovorax sp. A1169]
MNKNRIEGAAKQGERAKNREALVIKAKWRKCGGCAAKECSNAGLKKPNPGENFAQLRYGYHF